MSFIEAQDRRYAPLWERIREHRFLRETRDGTVPDPVFATWLRQDYLFVEAAIPFIAALIPKAPTEHWGPLSDVLGALRKELEIFEERAAEVGVELRGAPPAFACHAYVQFLLATAQTRGYAETYTVLYAAERAYHDSWKVVREGIDPASPWIPFVENWAGEEFAGYVGYLGGELEKLAASAGEGERERMGELYRLTLLYEIAFWEMAYEAGGWPGVEADRAPVREGVRWRTDEDTVPGKAWAHLTGTGDAGDRSGGPADRADRAEGGGAGDAARGGGR